MIWSCSGPTPTIATGTPTWSAMKSRYSCAAAGYGTTPRGSILPVVPSAKVDQGSRPKVALFLGRIHPKKRPDLLIKAWRDAGVGPEWKLVIAGSGDRSYISALMKLVRKLKLDDAIQFVGFYGGYGQGIPFRGRPGFYFRPNRRTLA